MRDGAGANRAGAGAGGIGRPMTAGTDAVVHAGTDAAGDRTTRALLRTVPVSWRLFLIVVLNGVATLALGVLVWAGATVTVAEWQAVRRVQAYDRLFVSIDSDVGRLQSLVHRYIHTPTTELLGEIDRRREALLGKLESTAVPDAEMAEDLARLTAASRRFLASFDAVRTLMTRLRQNYETAVLRTGGEMSALYAALDVAVRSGDPALLPLLGTSREGFANALLATNAYYLSADPEAAHRADAALTSIDLALLEMRAIAGEGFHRDAVDALRERVEVLRQGLATLRFTTEQQARLLGSEIDGGQRAMARIIDSMVVHGRDREAQAQQRFDEALFRIGWGIALLGVAFLSLSAAASWAIGQSIGRPLNGLMNTMNAIAGGDYDRPVHGTAVGDEIGAMARTVAVFRENAAVRRRMEAEREAQERRWRTMLESSPVGISIICAHTHARLYSNPKFDALFGIVDHPSALEWPVAESFVDPADVRRMLEEYGARGEVSGLEVQRRRLDGTTWWCLLDVRSMEYDGRPAYIVWHYDVTDRHRAAVDLRAAKERAETALAELRETQQSLIQAEKLASLGGLVAGVAHEINTPVGITVTAASLLADETRALSGRFAEGTVRRSDLQRYLDLADEATARILANADRAASLIHSFKQVAVDQTHDDRRTFDFGTYIREVLVSLGPRLKPSGTVVEVDCPDGVVIDGYPGPVAQVITNLVINALVHAFEPGQSGRIRVCVRPLDGDEVEMVFADDGRGIPAEVLPKIFDPFFTTNRGRGGTGLGLNIVYNIIQQTLRGRLAVDSRVGEGTTFTLRFPRRM
ncbi:ATP-binding protein [Azospirillum halopraeferens]|uniref:ATP-binding protein n=1 Tax=Azospirillum halopraeferens TaxID=34010 RepID=UPI0003FCCA48|nr:ATP-binding protein [Azospirillum halopraeferens]